MLHSVRLRIGVLLLLLAGLGRAIGQEAEDLGEIIREVQVGHAGVVKIGHWTPVRLAVDRARVPSAARLEFETVDSDAVPVVFRSPLPPDRDGWIHGQVCIGRISAGLTIRIVEPGGTIIASKAWNRLSDSFAVIPATEQILLRLGSPLNLASGDVAGGTRQRVISVDDPRQLPRVWTEFDGVDLVALATGGSENIALRMSAAEVDALWQWVHLGGRLVLSVGQNAGSLLGAGKPLERFGPGPFRGTETVNGSEGLEFYTGSAARQLITDSATQSLTVATFESVDGLIDVRQGNTPLIIRRSVGFGEIAFVCFDLEQPLIANWKGNPMLLSRLLGGGGRETSLVKSASHSSASNYGFRDLSGQVRASGERFTGVSVVTFVLVAALIVLYAICIGPLDYFLLSRVLGRMEWTWVTSTITTLVFAGIAWALVANSRPDRVVVNHAEIVDIDGSSDLVRGGIWSSIYSPRTQTFDAGLPQSNEFGVTLQTELISSMGLPGQGIGGMESRTVTRLFRDPYVIEMHDGESGVAGTIDQVPVAVASTKPLFAKWSGRREWPNLGEVTFQEQGKQLGGVVRSPFSRILRDCVVLYGNTAYLLGECPIGGTLDLSGGTERSLKAYLQSAEGDQVPRWGTGDRRVPRVFGMLMFFRAAGGEDFTGLSNDYQSEYDLSDQLSLGRAVFVGRIDDFAASPLSLSDGATSSSAGQKTTFVRIVFPVRQVRPNNR